MGKLAHFDSMEYGWYGNDSGSEVGWHFQSSSEVLNLAESGNELGKQGNDCDLDVSLQSKDRWFRSQRIIAMMPLPLPLFSLAHIHVIFIHFNWDGVPRSDFKNKIYYIYYIRTIYFFNYSK